MSTNTTISEHPLFPPAGGNKTITSERRLTA